MARPTNKARVVRLIHDFGQKRPGTEAVYLPLSRVRETIGGVRTDAAILDLIEEQTLGVQITGDGVLLAYASDFDFEE